MSRSNWSQSSPETISWALLFPLEQTLGPTSVRDIDHGSDAGTRPGHWNKRRPEAVLPVGTLDARAATSRDERARLPVFTGARVGIPMFSLRLTGVSFALIVAVACGSDYSTQPTAPSPTPAPALTPGGAT